MQVRFDFAKLLQGNGRNGSRVLKTINEIAQDYGVHPVQVIQWKWGDPGSGQEAV